MDYPTTYKPISCLICIKFWRFDGNGNADDTVDDDDDVATHTYDDDDGSDGDDSGDDPMTFELR